MDFFFHCINLHKTQNQITKQKIKQTQIQSHTRRQSLRKFNL